MAFIHLTRRELIAAAPFVLAAPTLVGGRADQVRTAQAMALVAERAKT